MIVTSRDGKKINKVYILNNCKPMGDYSNDPKEVDITFSCNSVYNERLGYLQWLSGLPNKEE